MRSWFKFNLGSWRLMSLVAIGIWLVVGVYGVFYNISYIDESKYLIKGWLMATGQIGYYSTPEFFYQHMPGGFLWYGLGQKLLGPNLLVARWQSFAIGLFILRISYLLAKKIGNKKTGQLTLMILSLLPVVIFYFSSAVTQSLAVLFLLLAFLKLFDKKYLWGSFWLTMALVVRENFLFTLVIYLVWLFFHLNKRRGLWVKNLIISLGTLAIFIWPGYPGTLNILKNFPGVSLLLPVSQLEQNVLNIYWQSNLREFQHFVRALMEFGVIYYICFLAIAWIGWLMMKNWKQVIRYINSGVRQQMWLFFLFITGINFLAHAWGAFKLSPRQIVSYFAYTAPMVVVIIASLITPFLDKKVMTRLSVLYLFLVLLIPVNIRFASIYTPMSKKPALRLLNESINPLKEIVKDKDKIVWLTDPMSLYLAGKVSYYYPLLNHTNFYKPTEDTETTKTLGFWNDEMMQQWLEEADLVVIDSNRIKLLREGNQLELIQLIEKELESNFIRKLVEEYISPGNLSFYERI
jgi:4-amino-4-deoxy-L-arabinose transferase-like glycosyltransferase